MSISSIFKSIEGWFAKVFKNAPAWNVVALSTLNVVAPLVETVITLVDAPLGAVVTPIITQIQADLGSASSLIGSASTNGLAGLLTAINTSLPTLLTEGHITDPASVAKAQAAVTTITSELESIIAAIPAA